MVTWTRERMIKWNVEQTVKTNLHPIFHHPRERATECTFFLSDVRAEAQAVVHTQTQFHPPHMAQQPLVGQGVLTITLRHSTLGKTPLDEWSARRRGLYLTTHNTQKRHKAMSPAGFEPAIPASKRPQTHVLDRAATGIQRHSKPTLQRMF
jgi:hypothetical protein